MPYYSLSWPDGKPTIMVTPYAFRAILTTTFEADHQFVYVDGEPAETQFEVDHLVDGIGFVVGGFYVPEDGFHMLFHAGHIRGGLLTYTARIMATHGSLLNSLQQCQNKRT